MTTMDDQELASLRQAFAADSEQTDPAPHLTPETIWDAVHGKLQADVVRESVQHVATCATCAEEWRLARTLGEQQEQQTAAPLPAPLRFTRANANGATGVSPPPPRWHWPWSACSGSRNRPNTAVRRPPSTPR